MTRHLIVSQKYMEYLQKNDWFYQIVINIH